MRRIRTVFIWEFSDLSSRPGGAGGAHGGPPNFVIFGRVGARIAFDYNPAMALDYLVSALVTLLVVVDPVGLTPTFLAVTQGLPVAARKRIASRACLIAAAILSGTALIGDWLLQQLAITLPAFRIAGGLLLFAVASEMVLGVRIERQSKQAEEAIEEHVRHVAAFPLAIPLMAGPGAITATLLLTGRAHGQPLLLAGLLGVVMIVVAVCLGAFLLAERIGRLLGVTGSVVLSRLLGVLLAALAVQFVIDGVRAALQG
jgi:multiple antibiotic resistance protein